MKRFLLVRGAELIALLVLAAIPLFITNPFALGLLTLLAIYGILLIGLDVTVGYLGQVNLGQAAFLGIGAYTSGLLVMNGGYGILPALGAAFVLCLILGSLLALPALRLEGPQFALATLSFGALAVTVLNEWEDLTLGAQGLSINRPALFGHTLDAAWFYWLCVALLALVWLGMRNLLSSQWGRAFEALRDSPIATDAMGVGTYRHKVIAFAFGSALGGLAGGLYSFNFQYLQPHSFTYELMVILLLGVVLGGRKSLWGAVVGAAFIVLLPNLLSNQSMFRLFSIVGFIIAFAGVVQGLKDRTVFRFQTLAPVIAMGMLVVGSFTVEHTEDWRKAIFALMLFSVVVGLPEGLMGYAGKMLTQLFRVPGAPLPPASNLDDVVPLQNADGSALLELKDLKRHFGGVKAVDGVNLVVKAGTVHGLIGPNGSGKSTAVNVISGLYTPTSGQLLLDGKELPYGSLYQVAGAGVSRTFQNLQLFGELSALDNVMVALRDTYKMPWPLVLLGLARNEEHKAQADALALLQLVGLEAQARIKAKDLTYGAQRFLEIARALARKPRLLILDEPAAGLAHPDAHNLVEIIRRIHGRGISIVLIEHHMDVVTALCNTVTVLDGGQVIAEGPAEEVKRNPKVVEAYLGAAA
ncbi:MAG: branched-chain amino acid ABC transporter ATP-binding protein/permease [Rhodocyclaceae bacterium]|nr:branched-chain amino acid ABC transporter ATP-binding protein/permease [Rhodocyclaceae bacterium]